MTPRSITVLGATGSVGASTLDLLLRAPEAWAVEALTANCDVAKLAEAARATRAKLAVVADEGCYAALKDALAGSGIEAAAGKAALCDAAKRPAGIVVAAIVGAAGLPSAMAAAKAARRILLANKEALVMAGALFMDAVGASGAVLLPVDSEHNAIFQVFDHAHPERVTRIIVTASGGPFRGRSTDEMRHVTPAQACAHPVWSMGAKISVDSATLMNKGLELIEAAHLFPVTPDQLEVIVHPQSVVHSFVEYIDGSMLAQLGSPDMRTPIGYCLAWPERMATPSARLDLASVASLTFEAPDHDRFPALTLAGDALRAGGSAPCILNAANEIAVAAFLAGESGFLDIAAIVADTCDAVAAGPVASLDEVVAIDAEARRVAAAATVRRRS